MQFICSIAAFKARNNHISKQNLSETAQNPARFFENNIVAHSAIAVLGYMRKKKNRKPCVLTKPRHLEERGKTSLQCPTCGQRLEIVVIRNAP